jgi:hypothetical protein
MMTLRQAEAIEREAQIRGVTVDEVVEETLALLGTPLEIISMRSRLKPQLEWLLAGKPLELAPYYEYFYETAEYPFSSIRVKAEQVDITIDEFVALVVNREG